jgi:Contractile injection system tube protein
VAPPISTTNPARAQLTLCEPVKGPKGFKKGSSIGVVEFLFNPKDYSMGLSAGWNFKGSKKDGEQPEYTGTQLRTLDVEMFLDATDKPDGDVSATIDALQSTVRPTAKSVSSDTPFPPIVVFSWGTTAQFVGVVKSVTSSLTLFRPTGRPVRATCKLSMQELETPKPKQNPTSGAFGSTRSHTVVLGDSLASVANAEYGAPTMWRAIAIANDLEDPFSLQLGRELLLPGAAEAAALA